MALIARGETPFGLLPVGGGGRAPPSADAQAAAAVAWWARVSLGYWRPCPVPLPPVVLPVHPAAFCAGGGMGPGPRNGPGLARAALATLPPEAARLCPPRVVVVAAAPIAPHAWRIAGGGVAVAPGRWVRRYAALPEGAPLGTWVHELAHLLLDWPDLPGSDCLMGRGALRGGGADPAPPAASLVAAAGWREGAKAYPARADAVAARSIAPSGPSTTP